MEGLNAREPISGLEFDCQLTFLTYGTGRKSLQVKGERAAIGDCYTIGDGGGFAYCAFGVRG